LAGLTGPRRLLVSQVPRGWQVQAILLNGLDVTDAALPLGRPSQSLTDVEVVLSRRVTAISGQVTARGRPAAAAVLLVSQQTARRGIRNRASFYGR
jgi:hypothetical protein